MQPSDTQMPDSSPTVRTPKRKRWLTLGIVTAVVLVAAAAAVLVVQRNQAGQIDPASVTIDGGGITPATIKVKQGQSIEWTNQDSTAHQLVADQQDMEQLSMPEPLQPGDAYSFTFERPGTFTYHDATDPEETQGTIIVE